MRPIGSGDMSNGKPERCCSESGRSCEACGKNQLPHYWCEVCGKAVPEKRCPFCGLKARRIRQ